MNMLILLAAAAASTGADCARVGSPVELRECALIELERIEVKLNRQWPITLKWVRAGDQYINRKYDDGPSSELALREAQRSWLKYRELSCKSEGYQSRGGSDEWLVRRHCLTRLTKQRITELQDYAPEGTSN
jgi:uncharacterized protein YecT (DUF1311 family)